MHLQGDLIGGYDSRSVSIDAIDRNKELTVTLAYIPLMQRNTFLKVLILQVLRHACVQHTRDQFEAKYSI